MDTTNDNLIIVDSLINYWNEQIESKQSKLKVENKKKEEEKSQPLIQQNEDYRYYAKRTEN